MFNFFGAINRHQLYLSIQAGTFHSNVMWLERECILSWVSRVVSGSDEQLLAKSDSDSDCSSHEKSDFYSERVIMLFPGTRLFEILDSDSSKK